MDEQEQVWLPMPGEPKNWYYRFELYRDQGRFGRSLLDAVHTVEAEQGRKKRSKSTPGAWNEAFKKYDWASRVAAYDRHQALEDAHKRDLALNTGVSQKHNRLEIINRKVELLDKLTDEDNDDHKFTARAHEMLRGYLDDAAQEMSDRVKNNKIDMTANVTSNTHLNIDLTKLSEEQLDILQKIANDLKAREAQ